MFPCIIHAYLLNIKTIGDKCKLEWNDLKLAFMRIHRYQINDSKLCSSKSPRACLDRNFTNTKIDKRLKSKQVRPPELPTIKYVSNMHY